jgi:hypothetical protein
MPDLDLKPTEYRIKGWKKPKRHLSDKAARWLMTGCGVWAGAWLFSFRNFITGDNPWLAAAVIALPGLALWIYLVVTDKPTADRL